MAKEEEIVQNQRKLQVLIVENMLADKGALTSEQFNKLTEQMRWRSHHGGKGRSPSGPATHE